MVFKNRQPKGMLIFLWGSGRMSPPGSDGVRGFRKKNRRFLSALFPISGADQKERKRLSQPSAEPALYGVKYSGPILYKEVSPGKGGSAGRA
ncbi:hypothetical protein BFP49_23275 [Bacillus licheniformis]|nr:hypothetical protein BFP49_23275 [Bacillus licheniformis]